MSKKAEKLKCYSNPVKQFWQNTLLHTKHGSISKIEWEGKKTLKNPLHA